MYRDGLQRFEGWNFHVEVKEGGRFPFVRITGGDADARQFAGVPDDLPKGVTPDEVDEWVMAHYGNKKGRRA